MQRQHANDSSPELRQVAGTSDDLVHHLVSRPPVYYGDGPFDPPSSDDEEEQGRDHNAQPEYEDDVETISLLSSTPVTPGRVESGGLGTRKVGFGSVRLFVLIQPELLQKHSSIRILGYTIVALVTFAGIIGVVASFMYSETSSLSVGRRRLTMDHVFNGTFYASQPDLNWVAEGVISTPRKCVLSH